MPSTRSGKATKTSKTSSMTKTTERVKTTTSMTGFRPGPSVFKSPVETRSRRSSMFMKAPPVFKSPKDTRSRRSSMFGVSNSKGGIRLNIAITPQDRKKFAPGTAKLISPQGMVTRTRRSSIYVKGGKLADLPPDIMADKGKNSVKAAADSTPLGSRSPIKSPARIKISSAAKPKSTRRSAKREKLNESSLHSTPVEETKPRSSRKRKNEEEKTEGKDVFEKPIKTPHSTRRNQKRKAEEMGLDDSLQLLAPNSKRKAKNAPRNKAETDDADNDLLFKTPAKSPTQLKRSARKSTARRSTKKQAKKEKSPVIKLDLSQQLELPSPIKPQPLAELNTNNNDNKLQGASPEKKEGEESKAADQDVVKQSMKVHLKKKVKSPKVMLVSPALTTPVRPPRRKKRKATPGRINLINASETEENDVKKTDNDVKSKVQNDSLKSDTLSLCSDTADLVVNTTSHTSTGAKCVIL